MKTLGFACTAADAPLAPFSFERRAPRANDVVMEILYCGVCHSDLHWARNDWGWTVFPAIPGHEIVGRVIEVGPKVKKYRIGDHVAVGCMVDSCQHCDQCRKGEEQLCREDNTGTYGGFDRFTKEHTLGGYSKHIVVREEFVLRVPDGLDLAKAAPLLCAGITTYSPLKTWNVGRGSRVGVIGLGGLGHMAVKLAAGMGAHVTVLSRTPDKANDARALGADALLVSSDEDAMEKAANGFDLIIDTVPVKHDLNPYMPLLDVDGTLVIVGQIGPLAEPSTVTLILGRRDVIARGGSCVVIGSMSGHRLSALTAEQDKALATTPADDLLALPRLQPDQVTEPLHAYQISKRCNSLRVMAEAVKWGKRGARVNAMSPGIVITPLAKDELAGPHGAGYQRMIDLSPAGRAGTPDEIGTLGALLMGADGAFITGGDFLIDGGVTASYWYGELAPK
jgi:uncharacterized zinc-type alcohol dehydrogenase-like protein